MVRDMLIGSTDFSSQSIEEIKKELENWIAMVNEVDSTIREIREELNQKYDGYYDNYATFNFKGSVDNSLILYRSVIESSAEILHGLDNGFQEYHVKLARRISMAAHEQHRSYRANWKDDTRRYNYGNPIFNKLESIYTMGSDMLGDLYDFGNLANRLDDFVGRNCRSHESKTVINNISGDNNTVKNQDNVRVITDKSTDNSITIGNENKLSKSLIGHNKKDDNKEPIIFSFIKGLILPVIAGAIIYYLGFN